MRTIPRLVAFDVDGTLIRGETICECIARHLGKAEEMKVIEELSSVAEIAAARRQMLSWYLPHGKEVILNIIKSMKFAPGAKAAFLRLRQYGIRTALASITWKFAVKWLAAELGADYAIGTEWLDTDEVADFWPEDKPVWLAGLLSELGASPDQLVVVGDSTGDIPMLQLGRCGYFVGKTMPVALPHVLHWPQANILSLVEHILATSTVVEPDRSERARGCESDQNRMMKGGQQAK